MADNNSAGGPNRYRKLSGIGILKRLFSWDKVQYEIVLAENEYLEIAGSLSTANKNIERFKYEIADFTEKLAKEIAAHELLKDSYETNSKNWAEDAECKAVALKKQQMALEAELADAIGRGAKLEIRLTQKESELSEKTECYDTLTAEYTALLHKKNEALDRLASSEEAINCLNAEFKERSRLFVPTIHELTRTVDSGKYQRECDLMEIHRLKTMLDASGKEIACLTQELNALKDTKKQMLTEINRMGFVSIQTASENRQKQEQLKEEQAKLVKEINQIKQTKQSLQSDLSEKQQTLSTYSAITDEIIREWKMHGDRTKACIAKAAGTIPAEEKYGFLALVSGHPVAFVAFSPASYEELRGADAMVREAAKKLANSVASINCRKEAFVVVPDECMMYITKSMYASHVCSVQVITPSQIIAVVRMIAQFVIYEKTQTR
ncbi:MAG: hypothetical protein LBU24_04765 [Methanocalculaceae archaeon]|nr:hypothetical protein [Methanocalculaceae archaeon]